MLDIVKKWVPLTYEAFEDYRIGGTELSAKEVNLMRKLLKGQKVSFEGHEKLFCDDPDELSLEHCRSGYQWPGVDDSDTFRKIHASFSTNQNLNKVSEVD